MIYLRTFRFPDSRDEDRYLNEKPLLTDCQERQELFYRPRSFESEYPFGVLSSIKLGEVEFEPITIFYGGNGCGKTTALNSICENLKLERDADFNKTVFFDSYTSFCSSYISGEIPDHSMMLTSDGIFNSIFHKRNANKRIDRNRQNAVNDYYSRRENNTFAYRDMRDYDELKYANSIRRNTVSKFAKENTVANIRTYSNGESAFLYFSEKIQDGALYLLDEPENSLSPKLQTELADLIENAARFYDCQFIISTHSPFLLAMKGAKIYDFDSCPVVTRRWTELENVRVYRDFILNHENEF